MKQVLFCLSLCLFSFLAFSQDKVANPQDEGSGEGKRYVTVKLIDGSTMVGVFDRLTSDSIFFEHEVLGYQRLPLSGVESFEFGKNTNEPTFVKAETESFYREYGFGKINHNRYSLVSNGFAPKKGETYFRSVWFLLHYGAEHGLTDVISIKVAMNAVYLPSISAKASLKLNETTRAGVKGGFMFIPTSISDPDANGRQDLAALFADAGVSFGTLRKNVSIGAGVMSYNGIGIPYFSFGAHGDLSDALALTFEMPYFGQGIRGSTGDLFLPMFIPKLFTKRSVWGIGLTLPLTYDRVSGEWGETIPIPMVTYSFRAGPLGPAF